MGYYTKHKLTMEGKDAQAFFEANRDVIAFALDEHIKKADDPVYYYDFDGIYGACFDHEHWNGGSGCKFYNNAEQFTIISKLFPDETFILEGVGEEHCPPYSFDHWHKTFKGGELIKRDWEINDAEEPTWYY
mgnify:CR=1 FL=1